MAQRSTEHRLSAESAAKDALKSKLQRRKSAISTFELAGAEEEARENALRAQLNELTSRITGLTQHCD